MTIDLDTERVPMGPAHGTGASEVSKAFGILAARWQPDFRNDRDAVTLDPDTQIGYVGERPVKNLITAATTCSSESDGKTAISLDWYTDDK
ncbi:hypothetical protein OG474_29845 [Kribbella sp. NBC_01505]|uniref:hypothetical protein n=1 Tax=Kribbella sp. NBC_01505 TaxID=2903580 RepID=UPI0038672D8A